VVAIDYVGPGDLHTFAKWMGLRAYSEATKGQNAITLVRQSDSVEQDFATLSDGTLDVSGITSWIGGSSAKVSKIWDQVGNTAFMVQTTNSNRPDFAISSGVPRVVVGTGQHMTYSGPGLSQPYAIMAAAKRSTPGAFAAILWSSTYFFGFNDVTNQARGRAASGPLTPTAAESAEHTLLLLLNGASSHFWVDGSDTSGSTATDASGSSGRFGDANGSFNMNGYWREGGFISGDPSASVAALDANASAYWGF
jgi:hypothetical protein